MGLIDDGIARFRGARAMLLSKRATIPRKLLEPEVVKGATFRSGDRVRDRQSGELFDVLAVYFEAFFTPAPGRSGD